MIEPPADTQISALSTVCATRNTCKSWETMYNITHGAANSVSLAFLLHTLVHADDDGHALIPGNVWLCSAEYADGTGDIIGISSDGVDYTLHWAIAPGRHQGFYMELLNYTFRESAPLNDYLMREIGRAVYGN